MKKGAMVNYYDSVQRIAHAYCDFVGVHTWAVFSEMYFGLIYR